MRYFLLLLPLWLLLTLTGQARAARIEVGPYLQEPQPDGVIVVFETDSHEPATVVVDTPAGPRRFVSPPGRHHEVQVAGLAPGRYRYRVVVGSFESPPSELSTAATGSAFSFIVFGDNRDGHANHARVVAAMLPLHPELLLNTGDLTSDGDIEPLWRKFFEIEAALLAEVPLYPALGNHEVKHDPEARHYHRFFTLPGTKSGSHSERYYSFRYANSLFIALDSNRSGQREQAHWLLRTLEAARQGSAVRHIFVFFHHPPFSVGDECGSAVEQGLWVPEFERYRVTAVFVGHEHAYEHMERHGVRYFVTGGGGAPLYTHMGNCPAYDRAALRLFRPEHHFLRVQIAGEQANLEAIGSDGIILDSVRLSDPVPAELSPPPEVPFQEVRLPAPAAISRPLPAPISRSGGRSAAFLVAPILVIGLTVLLLLRARLRRPD